MSAEAPIQSYPDSTDAPTKELRHLAYERFPLPSGIVEIRCSPGRITHVRFQHDGTWSVDEDKEHGVFKTFGEAEDRAREIGGDPDLRPPTISKAK
jgi:hypothetical protein